MSSWYQKLNKWGTKWANTRYFWIVMLLFAAADACVFPLPTPVFFIGLALLNISKTYKLAASAVLGTVLGTAIGYLIGHFAWLTGDGGFTAVAHFFFQHIPGFSVEHYEKVKVLFARYDFWIFFFAGYTPIPLMGFSISSGAFNVNLFVILAATLIGQTLFYFVISFLVVKIGTEFKRLFEKYINVIVIATTLIIVAIIIIRKVL
ncbi:MAG TPA: hypothetical protein VF857_08405 [Spirochaetota bacterium]